MVHLISGESIALVDHCLSFFFWPLHCLFIIHLRLPITPLGSSNFFRRSNIYIAEFPQRYVRLEPWLKSEKTYTVYPKTLTFYSKDNTLVMVYCNNSNTLTFYSKDNTLFMVYCTRSVYGSIKAILLSFKILKRNIVLGLLQYTITSVLSLE
jgi:hypothetical protein